MAGDKDNVLDPSKVAELLSNISKLTQEVRDLKAAKPAGNDELLKLLKEQADQISQLKQMQEDFRADADLQRANAVKVKVLSYEETIKEQERLAAELASRIPGHVHSLATSLMKKISHKLKDQNWDEVAAGLVTAFQMGKNKKTEKDLDAFLVDLKSLIQNNLPTHRVQKTTWGDIEATMKKALKMGAADLTVEV